LNLELSKIDNFKQLASLENEWCELHSRCSYPSIFNSFDYLYSACVHFQVRQEELYILLVRNLDTNKLVAIFPFCLTNFHWHRIKFNVIIYAGLNEADKPYPIIDGQFEEAAWKIAIAHIKKDSNKWNFLELVEIQEGLNALEILIREFKMIKFHKKVRNDVESPIFELNISWLEFWDKHKKMRKRIRKMESDFPQNMEFKVYTDIEELDYCMRNYIELESRSWKAAKKIGVSSSVKKLKFYSDFFKRLSSHNQLFFGFLYVDEKLVSAEIAYTQNTNVYFSHGVFDKVYAKYSPGMVSTSLFLKYFIESEYKKGDFLGGFAHYVNPWASQLIKSNNITIYRLTPKLIIAFILGKTAYYTLRPMRWLKNSILAKYQARQKNEIPD
jgi:hypothetical protein